MKRENKSGRKYTTENIANGMVLVRWGAVLLVDSPVTPGLADRLIPIHQQLVKKANTMIRGFAARHSKISTLAKELESELEVFKIKRVLPGTCKYCPI